MAAAQGGTFSPLSDAVESQAHHQIVQELQRMGFPRDRASRAAIAVSNAGRHPVLVRFEDVLH